MKPFPTSKVRNFFTAEKHEEEIKLRFDLKKFQINRSFWVRKPVTGVYCKNSIIQIQIKLSKDTTYEKVKSKLILMNSNFRSNYDND